MKRTHLSVGTVALVLAGHASAATFALALNGTITAKSPDCGPTTPDACYVESPWTGELRFDVDSIADGVYSGADVSDLSFTSNGYSFGPLDVSSDGLELAEVTLAGGKPSDLEIVYWGGGYDTFNVEGFGVEYVQANPRGGDNLQMDSGLLSNVPEPASAMLLLAGIALVGLRSRGASACSGRSSLPA